MSSIMVGYFLWMKGIVAVDEAESGKRSKLLLNRLEMEQLPPKLREMNPVFCLNLTKLFLQNNALSSLPDDLGKFISGLRVLCLDYNRLSTLPPSLPHMVHLKKLNISHNPLQDLPGVIFYLSNLKELWANSIGIMLEAGISGLKVPQEIGKLVRLRVLGLRNNGIDSLPREFSELKSLLRVSLSGNLFQSVPLMLFDLPTLVHINLDDNVVEDLFSENRLMKAQELRYFRLRNNIIPVTDELCKQLCKVAPKLKWCLLDGCLHEQSESPTKKFKGFFKPDSLYSETGLSDQTTTTEGLNAFIGIRESGPLTSNDENQPLPADNGNLNADVQHSLSPNTFSATTSTTLLNLHDNLSPFSSHHNDYIDGPSKSRKDENKGYGTKDNPKSNKELRRQSLHETSDDETRSIFGTSSSGTICLPTFEGSESCTSKHNWEVNSVPITIIDIDDSQQNQNEKKLENSICHCFQKISNFERVASALPSVVHENSLASCNSTLFSLKSSTLLSTTVKIDRKFKLEWQEDEMENTLLLCSQRPDLSSNPTTSSSLVGNDIQSTPMILLAHQDNLTPKNPSTTSLSEQDVNRITDTLAFPAIIEQEMKLETVQFCSAQDFPAATTPPNGIPTQLPSLQKNRPQIKDWVGEVMPKTMQQALNFGEANAPEESVEDDGGLECMEEGQPFVNNPEKLSFHTFQSRPEHEPRKKKQIKFSDMDSYLRSEENSKGLKNMSTSTADQKLEKNSTHHQNVQPSETESESMELIFTSPNPPNLRPSSIWTGSASICSFLAASSNFLNNNNSQNSIQQPDAKLTSNNSHVPNPSSTATVSLLQSLLNLDRRESVVIGDGNEETFFETRDNGLELDNSELEYSPGSSDIDVDDEDSESNWEQGNFVLNEEDFSIILRPVL